MGQSIEELLGKFELSPQNVKFSELTKVCDALFGAARQSGTSHLSIKLPGKAIPGLIFKMIREKLNPTK